MLHSIVFDETYACCCQCGWTESARGKTTVAEVGHSKVIHLTIWRRSKTIRIISDSFRPRFLISSFCSRVIMRVCLPRPISQQWQDSHLENIWVSSCLFNACVYDCIEIELLPEGRMMMVLDSWTTRNTPGLKQVGLVGHLWAADHYPDPKI